MLIFFDIDGVLRKMQDPIGILNPALVANLEVTCQLYQHVRIVISSSWKLMYSIKEIKLLFSEALQKRIIGVTPDLYSPGCSQQRLDEITSWISKHNYQGHWIVIDDQPNFFPPGFNQLLITDGSKGYDSELQNKCHDLITALSSP